MDDDDGYDEDDDYGYDEDDDYGDDEGGRYDDEMDEFVRDHWVGGHMVLFDYRERGESAM